MSNYIEMVYDKPHVFLFKIYQYLLMFV